MKKLPLRRKSMHKDVSLSDEFTSDGKSNEDREETGGEQDDIECD